jgi:hypothetical protein
MSDGIGLAEVLLGLPGFRVLDVVESALEVVITIESTAVWAHCRTCGVRAEPQDRMPVGRPASGVLRSAGTAAVDQAAVALPRAAVRGQNVDRDLRAGRRAGGADPACRGGGVPPDR